MASEDLIPGYSFKVSFDGIFFGFSKVSNISGSIDINTIVNGGTNDSPVIQRMPKRTPDMLVFEKGLYTSVKDMAFSVFKEGRKIDTISINVLRNGKTVRMFFATGGIVVRREFSPLDSINGGVFLEYLQVAHTGITEIPLPLGL